MKVLSVVGARPQFIKAAPVSRALAQAGLQEILVHTGQHYDAAMSDVFFTTLNLSPPQYHLGVGSESHGAQTGRMLEKLDAVIRGEQPDAVLVYGDTNSTLAGALAAAKLHVRVAHVEAGLRSFNRRMPEEVNRVLTDHVSDLLFAPTPAAIENLANEGITAGVVRTGDVMFDAVRMFAPDVTAAAPRVLEQFGLQPRGFVFVTIHRSENTDDEQRWNDLMAGLRQIGEQIAPVVWAAHPRVRARAELVATERLRIVEPQPYFETQALVSNSLAVVTDSGGLQKEAAFHGVPCVTLRDETEWVELVDAGVNRLAGTTPAAIVAAVAAAKWPDAGLPPGIFGEGRTSETIAESLVRTGRGAT
jgi:UDP-GlcNAc3NAcA epimerase